MRKDLVWKKINSTKSSADKRTQAAINFGLELYYLRTKLKSAKLFQKNAC